MMILIQPIIKGRTLVAFLLCILLIPLCAITQSRPNILIMLTDDQGYGDIGSHGNPYLSTPNIESIGSQGMEMSHFISYPNCSASRAAILTGRYPYRTGVTAVTQVDHFMNTSEVTIAEILSNHGYRTGIFGKWHLGDHYPMRPTDQGFHEALVHKGGGIGQAAGPPGNSYFDPILEHNNVSKKYEGYCDDIFTDAAINFVKENSNQPFFAFLATNLPHLPLQVPDEKAEPYRNMGLHEDNALTYGMIDNIDGNVGRVLSALEKLGIENNTLVIFLSDNGPRHRRTKNDSYPGRWVSNLRGTKTSVYDAGVRVPFFIQWPARITKRQKTSNMGTVIDLFPSVLEACNITLPDSLLIDGKSLMPLWTGEMSQIQDRPFFIQMHYGPTPFKYMHFAVRTNTYKLVSPHDFPHGIVHQPTDHQLKHVLKNLELYQVDIDSSERVNVASEFPNVVDDLLGKYEDWFDEVTEERMEKGIQKIHIGSKAQPYTTLSRFDWGGPRVISRFDYGGPKVVEDNQLGHWQVEVEKGVYNIVMDLPKVNKAGFAHLKFKKLHLKLPVEIGQKKVVFEKVELPKGRGNFHAYIKSDRLPTGPLFVHIKRNK